MKYNLSEVLDLIKSRRTIYPENFTSRKVHKEQIELLLNAAIWAPNHGKTQPWKFTVFTDEGLESLGKFLSESYLELTPKDQQSDLKLAKMINRPRQSTAVVAVSMVRGENPKIPAHEELAAVSAGVQNMLLAATAYGLGSFWSTPKSIYSDLGKKFFNLGQEDQCVGLIYLGYPGADWPKGQRTPIEYKTEWRTQ